MISVGTAYDAVAEANSAITTELLTAHLSYRVFKSEPHRYILKCRDGKCSFYFRAAFTQKHRKALVSEYKPHVCSPNVHFKFKATNSVKFLKSLHAPAVLDDRNKANPSKNATFLSLCSANISQSLSALRNVLYTVITSATCRHTVFRRR